MPAQRVTRSRLLQAEPAGVVLAPKPSDDIENRDPNTPHAVDQSPTKEINFSRKRPLTAIRSNDDAAAETPKRVRSTQQLNTDYTATPPLVQTIKAQRKHASPSASLSRRHASNPARHSRFKEASMHDRISDKPPSMFTRIFGSADDHGVQDMDQLMEDYHNDTAVNFRPATTQGQMPRPVTRQTQLAGLTHHANTSISENSVPPVPADSGIYRFGRSIASAFNPFKAWKSMQRSFRNTEEEMMKEKMQQAVAAAESERKAQIEAAYAELKRSGQIPTKTVVRPLTSMGIRPDERESGSQLNSTRSSADMRMSFHEDGSSIGSYVDARERPESRKSAFHVQRPSLNDLKQLPPRLNIMHGRVASFSSSPEKKPKSEDEPAQGSLSKRSLAKHQRLTKQVSDLEAKLDKARTELHSALNEAKPLPRLPTQPEVTPKKDKSPQKRFNITKKGRAGTRQPALESIPSERFLLREGDTANARDLSLQYQGVAQSQQPVLQPDLMNVGESRPSFSERSFLSDPSDPSDEETDAARATRVMSDPLMSELATAQVVMLNKPAPVHEESRDIGTAKASSSDTGKKTRRTSKKAKAKSNPHQAVPQPTAPDSTPAHTRQAALPPNTATHAHGPATHHAPASSPPPFELPPCTRPLSMVAEESAPTMSSIAVRLNDEPDHPTAVKTPAAYRSRLPRSRSSSPDKSTERNTRAQSPPPSAAYSKQALVHDEEVRVAPDGVHVPDVPGSSPGRGGPGSPFQWPEDCF